jgi:hypothetical protein
LLLNQSSARSVWRFGIAGATGRSRHFTRLSQRVVNFIPSEDHCDRRATKKRQTLAPAEADRDLQTYGRHPDYLHGAAAAISQKSRYVSGVESGVDSGTDVDKKKKLVITGRSGRI